MNDMNSSSTKWFWKRLADILISPSVAVQEVGARRQAQLLATMTLSLGILNTAGILAIPNGRELGRSIPLFILSILLFAAYGLGRTRFYQVGSWLVVISISISAFYLTTAPGSDPQSVLLTFLPLTFVLGIGLLPQLGLIILVVLNTVVSFLIPTFMPAVSTQGYIGGAGIVMTLGVLVIIVNAVQLSVERSRREELLKANRELLNLQSGLELRVADRTKALQTSAEVSRRLTSILDPNELARAVVNQIQSAFNYYYAQIYLFDDAGENLVLSAGTGEAGAEMMRRGQRLPKGRGLVGRAAENNASVLVADTSQDPDWLPNQLLPDTKSETAIPIAIGDRVLGVLDVQDDVTNDITSEDVILLESLAGQVAISLQNARQYLDSTRFRLGIENSGDAVFTTDVNGTITYANAAFEKVYGYSPTEVIGKNPRIIKSGLLDQENYQQFWRALLSKQSVTGEIINKHKDGHLVNIAGTNSAIVNDAGEIVGFLAVHHDITEQKSNQELVAKRARQQEAINTITQSIQSATTIEEAMQVAARELGHALGKRQTLVALDTSALTNESKVDALQRRDHNK